MVGISNYHVFPDASLLATLMLLGTAGVAGVFSYFSGDAMAKIRRYCILADVVICAILCVNLADHWILAREVSALRQGVEERHAEEDRELQSEKAKTELEIARKQADAELAKQQTAQLVAERRKLQQLPLGERQLAVGPDACADEDAAGSSHVACPAWRSHGFGSVGQVESGPGPRKVVVVLNHAGHSGVRGLSPGWRCAVRSLGVGQKPRRHTGPSPASAGLARSAAGKIAAATVEQVGTVAAAGDQQASTDLVRLADEKPVGEYSGVGENSPSTIGEKTPLAKIQKPLSSSSKDFSPTHFSPTRKPDFSPTKKPRLSLVKPSENGQRGRPRTPELPPAPGKYFYWTKARNGLKLERCKKLERKTEYEYVASLCRTNGNILEEISMKNTSSEQSSPQFELNALAPLRVGGLARSLLENKNNPAEVERIANELLTLEPHLIELLIAEGEKAPSLT